MKTLLIVEDEKMIRQGIATMAKRCSVPIETILECRNGVEALEILKERQIDVMFTDIRSLKSQLRYLLLNHEAGMREWEMAGEKIAQLLKGEESFENGYVIGIGNKVDEIPESFGFVTEEVNGQNVFFLDGEELEEARESVPEQMHPGFSAVHTDFGEIS